MKNMLIGPQTFLPPPSSFLSAIPCLLFHTILRRRKTKMIPCFCSQTPSATTISTLLMLDKSCTNMKHLKKLHAQIIKTGLAKDPFAASRILAFCTSPAGDINYAYLVFKQIPHPNLFIWNTIIRGFAQSSNPQIAIYLFLDMLLKSPVQPQRLTYPSVFKACAQLNLAQEGAQLHGRIIKLGLEIDPFIRNTILHLYASCGYLNEARKLFDRDIIDFDVVTWNIMIMGLAKHGLIEESRRLFDKMSCKNIVSWNSMIGGYVRKGRFSDALKVFDEMLQYRIKPNEFTMVSLLNACGCLGAIKQGEWVHYYMLENKFEMNSIVITALIDMYSKCGSAQKAQQVFEGAPKKNLSLSCWNSMILGLATNGLASEAIQSFLKLWSSNLKPDSVTFIGVLTSCNHSGLVDKALNYFLLMEETYKIKPSIQHYSCMVDVLGRAGRLEEAEELIRKMGVDPDEIIWGSLLWSCCKYGNVEMAERAAKHLIELDPSDTSGFVLMANLYAASGDVVEAVKHRLGLKEMQKKKEPGCSLIEVDGELHEFVAGGRMHPNADEIYYLLTGCTHI